MEKFIQALAKVALFLGLANDASDVLSGKVAFIIIILFIISIFSLYLIFYKSIIQKFSNFDIVNASFVSSKSRAIVGAIGFAASLTVISSLVADLYLPKLGGAKSAPRSGNIEIELIPEMAVKGMLRHRVWVRNKTNIDLKDTKIKIEYKANSYALNSNLSIVDIIGNIQILQAKYFDFNSDNIKSIKVCVSYFDEMHAVYVNKRQEYFLEYNPSGRPYVLDGARDGEVEVPGSSRCS